MRCHTGYTKIGWPRIRLSSRGLRSLPEWSRLSCEHSWKQEWSLDRPVCYVKASSSSGYRYGQSSSASLMRGLKQLIFAAGVCLLVVGCSKEPDMTMAQMYPEPWHQEFDASISKALAVNNIRGCGQYMYRAHYRQKGEYLVYCTGDGKFWTAYLVWAPIEKVMGPYPPDKTIPAP